MTSGIFTYVKRYSEPNPDDMREEIGKQKELLYYRDGLTATVTVGRSLTQKGVYNLFITTNGKTDGSSQGDMTTQRLLAHLPMLVHPNPTDVCVIGMGTGCTAGSASLYPMSKVTVVEIEEAMVEGARFFRDHNYAVHKNPKVDIQITDARLFLKLHRDAFDVITSEPSNPWLAGTADLFTQDFYEIGARALRSKGIYCQWVPIYEMSQANLQMVIRTFASVFPHAYVACAIRNADILLLGSKQPIHFDPQQAEQRMALEQIRQDLSDSRVQIDDVYDLLARIIVAPDEIARVAGPGPLHTDDHPILAYRAPMDLYLDTSRSNILFLTHHATGIAAYLVDGADTAMKNEEVLSNLNAAYRAFLPNWKGRELTNRLGSN